jgi:elongation factor P
MKVTAIDVRPGNVLEDEGKLWLVSKIHINQPGKGAAVIQVEMRDIKGGTKRNIRYRTQETLETATMREHEMQYLYSAGEEAHFMNQENYDQVTIPLEMIGEPARFLQDNMVCAVLFHEETPITVKLPKSVTLTITEAEPVIKGQTVTSSYKSAVLENGVKIQVPPHISAGDRVVVKTEDGSYMERSKE